MSRRKRQPSDQSPLYSPDTTEDIIPLLEIVEQPNDSLRFRYLSELSGTPHGPLMGQNSTRNKKIFPTVRLLNYFGEADINCWLIDNPDHPTPHVHRLVSRRGKKIIDEPHTLKANRENNFTVSFENLVILHAVQKDSEKEYHEKINKWANRHNYCDQPADNSTKSIKEIFKSTEKNVVYLYFEAIVKSENSSHFLCSTVSTPIKNLKNPECGELKIFRQSHFSGTADGGDIVFIFVSKLPKDIRIEFADLNAQWIGSGLFSQSDVHAKSAIAFKTPKYPFPITNDTEVSFKLIRETDGVCSNSCSFMYKPSSAIVGKKRKLNSPDITNSYHNSPDSTERDVTNLESNNVIVLPAYENLNDDDDDDNGDYNIFDQFNSGPSMSSGEWSDNFRFIDGIYQGTSVISGEDSIECDGISESFSEMIKKPIFTYGYNSKPIWFHPAKILGYIWFPVLFIFNKAIDITEFAVKHMAYNWRKWSGNNTYIKCSEFLQLMFDAVRSNDINKFKHFFYVCCKNKDYIQLLQTFNEESGKTILQEAIIYQRLYIVNLILSQKCFLNLSVTDENRNTLHHLAAERHSLAILKMICSFSKLFTKNYDGMNCLHLAVKNNIKENVAFLASIFDLNAPESKAGNSPLHLAVEDRNIDLVNVLIQAGAHINCMNMANNTPLHLAVINNDTAMVKLLLENGADGSIPHGFLLDDMENNHFSQFLNNEISNDLMILTRTLKKGSEHNETDDLLTEEQTKFLTDLLSKNQKWKELVKALDKDEHLMPTFLTSDKPANMLLSYIDLHREEIFHCIDKQTCLYLLDNVFCSIGIEEAGYVLNSLEE